MQRGERIRNAVLRQIVARRHLPAKTVAPVRDGHLGLRVRRCLHQNGHSEMRQPQRIRDGAFVSKIRQSHNHAVNRIGSGVKQFSAPLRFFVRFDRTVLALFWSEHHHLDARILQDPSHLLPPGLRQMVRKKAPVPYDQSHCHFSFVGHGPLGRFLFPMQLFSGREP